MQITKLNDDRRPVLVVSHERSGTHFTMNTLAKCFGYVSNPWFDVDRSQLNINYFAPHVLRQALLGVALMRPANVLKSHHEFEFFSQIVDELADTFHVIYVHRHPADCLASYWRLLNSLNWMEGPRCATALEFATTPPMARLMRYQYRQYVTMLDRWANHVRGWLAAAERNSAIRVIRYEDLARDFPGTVQELGHALGLTPQALERPSPTENVIMGAFQPAPGADNRVVITDLALRTHPELMDRLGYRQSVAIAG